jgi:hypothetical protein
MPDIEKRLRYFKGQFLKAKDFIDEQEYHSDRLERHTRFLHSPGVANGLEVKGDINTAQVTVTSGTAIDGNGKQIVLIGDRVVRVDRDELKGKEALIVISYGEVESDPADVGAKENTRWHEVPNVTAVLATENPSDTQFIRLASVSVNDDGNLREKPKDLRQKAGQPAIADGSIAEIKLDLAVRNKLIGGATGTARISHSTLNLDGGTNPHGTTATDVKALPIAGGALTGRFRVQTNAPGTVAATGTPVISGLGSAFVLNTTKDSYALIAKVSDIPDVLPNSGVAIPPAALVAIAGFDGSHGIYTTAKAGTPALKVDGNVEVNGTVNKRGGTFRIDHPLDPANKYLSHSFVESPDMKNIYDGVVILDARGEAVVDMPTWFAALNKDLRYQLTCIGGYAPVYIAQEVEDNQFKIAGGTAGLKVSWQVTGVRQDAWANDHPIPVEEWKPIAEQGTYLYQQNHDRASQAQVAIA